MAEPGRNAPCPCGSGKKYKKCCLPNVQGVAVPARPLPGEPRNVHLVQMPDVTWEERPGSLLMRVGIEATDAPDAELRDSFRPYLGQLGSHQVLGDRIRDCEHKCRAAGYHFRVVQGEIEREVARFAAEHRAQSGVGFEWRNEVLLYETEAFLFQAKSAVDMLVRLLGPVVPSLATFDSFQGKGTVAGGAALDALRQDEPALHQLFENARQDWIQELKDLRDQITHVSRLKQMGFFIENQYFGGDTATIDYPTIAPGKRLDAYCGDVVDKLWELTRAVLDEIVARAGKAGGE